MVIPSARRPIVQLSRSGLGGSGLLKHEQHRERARARSARTRCSRSAARPAHAAVQSDRAPKRGTARTPVRPRAGSRLTGSRTTPSWSATSGWQRLRSRVRASNCGPTSPRRRRHGQAMPSRRLLVGTLHLAACARRVLTATGRQVHAASHSFVSASSSSSSESAGRARVEDRLRIEPAESALAKLSAHAGLRQERRVDEDGALDLDVVFVRQEDDVLVGERAQAVRGGNDPRPRRASNLPCRSTRPGTRWPRTPESLALRPLPQPAQKSALGSRLERLRRSRSRGVEVLLELASGDEIAQTVRRVGLA